MDDRTRLYTSDEYVEKNPSMHREDSPWKLGKIRPFLDGVASRTGSEITILDVGGGTGEILAGVADHLRSVHGKVVTKYAIDLTPAMLEEQARANPDLRKHLSEDIRKTTLRDKEVDLTLMVDVIEHVPEPNQALQEIRRISRYAIFKVPLEDNLHDRLYDALKQGALRRFRLEQVGHINTYNYSSLRRDIERHLGRVLGCSFTNAAALYLSRPATRKVMNGREVLTAKLASSLHRLSGRLEARLFSDFVVLLAECR